jgi:TM2 domain-containing membrane protein YozV
MKKPFSEPQDKKKLKYVSSMLIAALAVGFTIRKIHRFAMLSF